MSNPPTAARITIHRGTILIMPAWSGVIAVNLIEPDIIESDRSTFAPANGLSAKDTSDSIKTLEIGSIRFKNSSENVGRHAYPTSVTVTPCFSPRCRFLIFRKKTF